MTGGQEKSTVVHVVENLDVGGLENVVMNLLDPGAGRYRGQLVCLGDGGALAGDVRDRGVEVDALNRRPGLDWFLLPRLRAILRKSGAAVIHCHNFSPLVYGAVAARWAGTRALVYTAHGAKTSGRARAARMRIVAPPSAWVYVSDDARRVAVEQGAVPAAIARTVSNGVDCDRFESGGDRGAIRSELGIPQTAPVAGIVARLTAAKDHAGLLEAFRLVRETAGDAYLLVVGDGELRADLMERARRLKVDSSVVFTGARSDVPALLSAMDVFVLSSKTEGLAMTLLEAMAAGLPVVATRAGGNSEAVLDGHSGILVDPGDPVALARELAELLQNGLVRERMGRAGRARVRECFSVEAMRSAYETIYDELLGVR